MAKRVRSRPEPALTLSGPIEIVVGWQHNGGVYRLAPLSSRYLLLHFPDALPNPSILIGYRREDEVDLFHRPNWPQIAQMVTGLTAEQIGALGGVVIVEPLTGKLVWEWQTPVNPPGVVTRTSYEGGIAAFIRSKKARRVGTGT